eukprot:TRINITY_DN1169_c0_g1_i1.p1 TRINITY_DN1169_c0_g1~~TRINITY_DN1169_c0_g1_i1.p1  ORF type:complete len:123 (-),score=40.54 TRINITY_DN1169_c0_g1_i1:83-451(-)
MAKSSRASTVKKNKAIARKKIEVFEKKRLEGILEKMKEVVEPPPPFHFATPTSYAPRVVVEIEDDEEGGDVEMNKNETNTTTKADRVLSNLKKYTKIKELQQGQNRQPKKERVAEMLSRKRR